MLGRTYVADGAIGKLSVPLILDLLDLAVLVKEDVDDRANGLLLADTGNNVSGLEVHRDGVTGRGDFVAKTLDLLEGCLKTVL